MMSTQFLVATSFAAGLFAGAALLSALGGPAGGPLRAPPPAPEELSRVQEQLVAERMGRVRAERSLRDAVNSRHAGGGYPLLPIGRIASPFRGRWGTPRQPMLAPHARAHVLLSPAIPADALRGLAAYSHVFVLFLFDANSSLHKMGGTAKGAKPPPPQTRAERRAAAGGGDGGGEGAGSENEEEALSRALRERHFNALVEAPALKGGRTGVLSTRSPHRPNAVGLSLCRLVSVHDRAPGAAKPNSPMLVLSGCDLVSGTPVIDIKPVRARRAPVFFPAPPHADPAHPLRPALFPLQPPRRRSLRPTTVPRALGSGWAAGRRGRARRHRRRRRASPPRARCPRRLPRCAAAQTLQTRSPLRCGAQAGCSTRCATRRARGCPWCGRPAPLSRCARR
jgi:tRNA (Thr-GGU) A37 N-methylase